MEREIGKIDEADIEKLGQQKLRFSPITIIVMTIFIDATGFGIKI